MRTAAFIANLCVAVLFGVAKVTANATKKTGKGTKKRSTLLMVMIKCHCVTERKLILMNQ